RSSRTGLDISYILFMVEIFFFFQAEDGIRDYKVTGVQTCALPIFSRPRSRSRSRPSFTSSRSSRCVPCGSIIAMCCQPDCLPRQIGRASCREREEMSVVVVAMFEKE